MQCVHCGRPHNIHGKRGLCWTCYRDKRVRALHERRSRRTHETEPTMAELDALVAEQRRDLPAWWHRSYIREDDR